MLPAFLACLLAIGLYYVSAYLITVLRSPIDFFHEIETKEAAPLHRAGQFVVYFMAWPFLFMFYSLFGLLSIMLYFEYTLANFFAYLWTLCGFNYHALITNEDPIALIKATEKNVLALIFDCIAAVLIIVVIVLYAAKADTDITTIFVSILGAFLILYPLISFKER